MRRAPIPLVPLLSLAALIPLGSACKSSKPAPGKAPAAAGSTKAEVKAAYANITRARFNQVAAELALPLLWREDADRDGALDPDELAVLWGVADTRRGEWVEGGAFTAAFTAAYRRMQQVAHDGHTYSKLTPEDRKRRQLVLQELRQGRPTLVASRFTSSEDRAIVGHLLEAAGHIETLYALQRGVHGLAAQIPDDDAASRMMFFRNQGPWCVAPATESNPGCNALGGFPPKISGLYPATLQADEKFCEALARPPHAKALLSDHFSRVVTGEGGKLEIEPYPKAYAEPMAAVAASLRAAAGAIQSDSEAAFKAYLLATAGSFESNDWDPANETWSKMNVHNSRWYLRIGPDEVYFEPCSVKAGFHMSFGLINQDSLKWQQKLDPVKGEMEKALAALAGPPYKAREVSFHLPDFVQIVLNAGDSRSPAGATIGQSLPNWGPVANEGRGRTVAMTNFYTDADSKAALTEQVKSILCADSMKMYTSDPQPQIMSTVLHEAAHNLGPSHDYKVGGKTDDQVFGGPLASTLEELKAQTAALYFTDWLAARKLITQVDADQAHTRDVVWAFGHISRGMYSATNKPKPYSQLAAIQLGALISAGAVKFDAEARAANGTDTGCLSLKLERFAPAIEALGKTVFSIKSRGDKATASKLVAEHVDSDAAKALHAMIAERWLRSPKASFVYSIDM